MLYIYNTPINVVMPLENLKVELKLVIKRIL